MSTKEILLVEDQKGIGDSFQLAFGDNYDWCKSTTELVTRFPDGGTWKYAFVDFMLVPPDTALSTGLGTLLYLKQHVPETKVVVFTQLDEEGRRLFALAAYHWFGVRIIKDKIWVGAAELREIYEGKETMRRSTLQDYSHHAHLIDALFAGHWWQKAWAVWHQAGGNLATVETLMRTDARSRNTLVKFRHHAEIAVANLLPRFYPAQMLDPDAGHQPRAYTLVQNFARQNNNFFSAPELDAVLDYSQPWKRVRLAD